MNFVVTNVFCRRIYNMLQAQRSAHVREEKQRYSTISGKELTDLKLSTFNAANFYKDSCCVIPSRYFYFYIFLFPP